MAATREEEMLAIYKMLTPRPKELLLSPRQVVKRGYIKLQRPGKRTAKDRYLFLFNDVLLITKREKKKRFWLKTYIRLQNKLALEDKETTMSPNVEFHLKSARCTFFFFANSPAAKQEWVAALRACFAGDYDLNKAAPAEVVTVEVEVPAEPQAAPPAPAPEVITETSEVFKFGEFDVSDFLEDGDGILDGVDALSFAGQQGADGPSLAQMAASDDFDRPASDEDSAPEYQSSDDDAPL